MCTQFNVTLLEVGWLRVSDPLQMGPATTSRVSCRGWSLQASATLGLCPGVAATPKNLNSSHDNLHFKAYQWKAPKHTAGRRNAVGMAEPHSDRSCQRCLTISRLTVRWFRLAVHAEFHFCPLQHLVIYRNQTLEAQGLGKEP